MTMKNGNTIAALRGRIARGELSHEALIDEVLEAAGQPAAQHVFTRLYADAARAAARHADAARKAGERCRLYAGLACRIGMARGGAGRVGVQAGEDMLRGLSLIHI